MHAPDFYSTLLEIRLEQGFVVTLFHGSAVREVA